MLIRITKRQDCYRNQPKPKFMLLIYVDTDNRTVIVEMLIISINMLMIWQTSLKKSAKRNPMEKSSLQDILWVAVWLFAMQWKSNMNNLTVFYFLHH